MIIHNENTFHLQGRNISYIMAVDNKKHLQQIYFGKKLRNIDYSAYLNKGSKDWMACDNDGESLENVKQEYPAYGNTDLRSPAFSVLNRFGNTVTDLKYDRFEISEGTAEVRGMPGVYQGTEHARTLKIYLDDRKIGLEICLLYTVFDEYDVILRSTEFVNRGKAPMQLEKAYSVSLDLEKTGYEAVYFPGAWCRERAMERVPLRPGIKLEFSNARGGSGNIMNPFVMLCSPDADEKHGEVYGFSLVYSGNHATVISQDTYGIVRVHQGINPQDFKAGLIENDIFATPQTIMCYSASGFGELSRKMHDLYRNNLCKNHWVSKDRPVLINNWEGTYFHFTEEKLLAIAQKAKTVGAELFVLDDGWFGRRNNDNCSLGDWYVNREKLPAGIEGLAEKVNAMGLEFGLWFEPEMVNPDSDLYRLHPDWAIAVPNEVPALGRHQYMLDLAKDEVCRFIIDTMGRYLRQVNIRYIKWDYNRVMTDMPYKGYNHQYTLGLYKVMEALTKEFPDVLLEGCSGGGGRFDAGMLAYAPQIWTSDNSDAVSRLKIQYATSFCYPLSTMSAHVTVCPNHEVGRITPLKTRAEVAYAGVFGYELDITQMPENELKTVTEQICCYKDIRTLVRTGDFYRLQNPYTGNYCGWQIVSKDKKRTLLFSCRVLCVGNVREPVLYPEGLKPDYIYEDEETGRCFGGDILMNLGVVPEYAAGDFNTYLKMYRAVEG